MLGSKLGLKHNNPTNVNSSANKSTDSNVSYVIAKYDYQSQGKEELSIKKGDRLKLIDDSRHWWKVSDKEGTIGFVPSNYVKREKHSLFDSIRRNIRVGSKSNKTALSNLVTSNKTSPTAIPLINTAIDSAFDNTPTRPPRPNIPIEPLRGYDNQQQQQSNLRKQTQSHSDILVQELGADFNGFCISTNNGQRENSNGNQDNITSSNFTTNNNLANKTTLAISKYSYKSNQSDELSLTKGQEVKVLEKSDDGWWRGELDGRVGWFPSNYVVEQENSFEWQSSNIKDSNQEIPNKLEATAAINASFDHLSQESNRVNYKPNVSSTNDLNDDDLELKLQLNSKIWYHGVMSRPQCDQILNAYAEDGDFLVRNSETGARDFSISLKAPYKNKHFRVNYIDNYFCIGQRRFNSLDELVEHYKRTPIYTSSTGEKMFLKKAYLK